MVHSSIPSHSLNSGDFISGSPPVARIKARIPPCGSATNAIFPRPSTSFTPRKTFPPFEVVRLIALATSDTDMEATHSPDVTFASFGIGKIPPMALPDLLIIVYSVSPDPVVSKVQPKTSP
ncbi:hypothetical protein D3C78_1286220 [compost metagenome]